MEEAASRAEAHRGALVDAAVAEYFRNLPAGEFPRQDALAAAVQNAQRSLRDGLWQPEWLAQVPDGAGQAQEKVESLKLTFLSLAPSLRVPTPVGAMEVRPRSMGYAAALGATLGLLAMLALSRVLTGTVDRLDIGIVISAPLGAFAMVALAGWISGHKRLLRMLQAALGVATAAELWAAVAGAANPLGRLWRRIGGRHPRWGLLRRLLTYVAIILLLEMVVRRPTFYRNEHEASVRQAVEQWLDAAIRLQAAMFAQLAQTGGTAPDGKLAALARQLYAIQDSSPEQLPVAAAELIQQARNAGFEGLEGEPSFLVPARPREPLAWKKEMAERYETFGHVEEGDPVRVEREAVVRHGQVLVRGLVRKARGGRT
jgi:hypothetical protein